MGCNDERSGTFEPGRKFKYPVYLQPRSYSDKTFSNVKIFGKGVRNALGCFLWDGHAMMTVKVQKRRDHCNIW